MLHRSTLEAGGGCLPSFGLSSRVVTIGARAGCFGLRRRARGGGRRQTPPRAGLAALHHARFPELFAGPRRMSVPQGPLLPGLPLAARPDSRQGGASGPAVRVSGRLTQGAGGSGAERKFARGLRTSGGGRLDLWRLQSPRPRCRRVATVYDGLPPPSELACLEPGCADDGGCPSPPAAEHRPRPPLHPQASSLHPSSLIPHPSSLIPSPIRAGSRSPLRIEEHQRASGVTIALRRLPSMWTARSCSAAQPPSA